MYKIAQWVLNMFQLVLFLVMLCCFLLSSVLLIANVTQGGYKLIVVLLCDTHSSDVIPQTLHLLEGLLLSPLPFIISTQLYELSITIGGHEQRRVQRFHLIYEGKEPYDFSYDFDRRCQSG
jgi:hypothetical protein